MDLYHKNDESKADFGTALNSQKEDVYAVDISKSEDTQMSEMYTMTKGLSEAIDRDTFLSIKNKDIRLHLRDIVISELKPGGIDKSLWKKLNENLKKKIIDCYQKGSNKMDEKEKRPDEVISTIWDNLNVTTQKKINYKVSVLRPHGINPELWSKMNEIDRFRIDHDQQIKKKESTSTWFQRLTEGSRVVSFFSAGSHCIIEEPDAGVSAMALVCALILTIPYSLFGFLNNGFFTGVTDALNACPNGISKYGYTSGFTAVDSYSLIMQAFGVALYGSMMGLIVMAIFFLFKPLPGKDMDKWVRSQGRGLLALMYIVTLIASVGVVSLSSLLLNFAGQYSELCNYDSRYLTAPGIVGVILAFSLSMICMW